MTKEEQDEITELEAQVKKEKGKARRLAALAKAHEAKKAKKARLAAVAVEVNDDEEVTLSEIELKAIEEEERKKIRLEKRKRLKADAAAAIRRRLEQEMGITEPVEEVYIDLGGQKHNAGATYVMIDGVRYNQDQPYKLRASVVTYIRELLQNCDSHQCEIEGNSRRYNRLRNTRVGPMQANMPNSALLRV